MKSRSSLDPIIKEYLDLKRRTDYANRLWFKVLKNGKSFLRGSLRWSLPREKKSGAWHTTRYAVTCSSGIHVTEDPEHWFSSGCEVYVVDIPWLDPQLKYGEFRENGKKIAVSKCRLLRLATVHDLELVRMALRPKKEAYLFEGRARVAANGHALADGTSSSTFHVKVEDRGVLTLENGTAWVTDHGTVNANEKAFVEATGNATVYAKKNSLVEAKDYARVFAADTAVVHARGAAEVFAENDVTVYVYDTSVKVFATGRAIVRRMEDLSYEEEMFGCLLRAQNSNALLLEGGKSIGERGRDRWGVRRSKITGTRRFYAKTP